MKRWFCAWVALLLTAPGWAQQQGCLNECLEVKGVASFAHADVAWARQMALRDALNNALMQCQATVESHQQVKNYQLTHSNLTVRARAAVKGFTILGEAQDPEDKLYSVRLKVCLQPASSACSQPMGTGFHPRLAVATVLVATPYEARDIRDLPEGWRRALIQKLRAGGYGNVQAVALDPQLFSTRQAEPNLDAARLSGVREDSGAQFLLLTAIESLAPRHRTDTVLPDALDWMVEGVQRAYNYELDPNERDITLRWYLIDLNHHRIVRQGQLSRHVKGAVRVGRDKPFGSLAFARTPTGKAMLELVTAQASELTRILGCMPFEAEVLEVRKGGEGALEVVFFATPESGLREGDQLTVYHLDGEVVRQGGRALGQRMAPVGFIRVRQVLDRFAVAEVVARNGEVRPGDVIRSW